jgi:hypothetical protein
VIVTVSCWSGQRRRCGPVFAVAAQEEASRMVVNRDRELVRDHRGEALAGAQVVLLDRDGERGGREALPRFVEGR